MASTIITKNGSGAPLASDLEQGELAVDLANKRLYTEDSGGTVIEVGTNPTSVTTTFITAEQTANAANVSVAAFQNDGVGALTKADIDFFAASTKYATISGGFGASSAELDIKVGNTPVRALTVANGGDISFYEDTGTTAKFFWDASAESLGIGTTTPSFNLHVSSGSVAANQAIAGFFNPTDTVGEEALLQVGGTLTDNYGVLFGATPEVSTPSLQNHAFIVKTTNGAGMSHTEKMRVTASGNLLVGKTSTATLATDTTAGSTLYGIGIARHVASSSPSLQLTRTSTDGDIAVFTKDGTTVGSIGSLAGRMYLGTGDTNLFFNDSDDRIYAVTAGGTAVRDAAIDLGDPTVRFKDLFLSGGVYLGGTGAANHLDDYEEGTWTPVVEGSSTAGSYTYSGGIGVYTKAGRQVTISCQLTNVTQSTAGSGYIKIVGLPFSKAGNMMFHGAGRLEQISYGASNTSYTVSFITASATGALYFRGQESAGPGEDILITDINSGTTDIELTITYFV